MCAPKLYKASIRQPISTGAIHCYIDRCIRSIIKRRVTPERICRSRTNYIGIIIGVRISPRGF